MVLYIIMHIPNVSSDLGALLIFSFLADLQGMPGI